MRDSGIKKHARALRASIGIISAALRMAWHKHNMLCYRALAMHSDGVTAK